MDELTLEMSDRAAWREWLHDNHDSDTVVWLVIYKRSTGKKWITYQEALDEAICYGWIDSRTKSAGPERHVIRFTKRKNGVAWSLTNLRKARSQIENGRMTEHGLSLLPEDIDDAIKAAEESERMELVPPEELSRALIEAGSFDLFMSFSPSHRRTFNRWVNQAKSQATKQDRVDRAVDMISRKEMPGDMSKWKNGSKRT